MCLVNTPTVQKVSCYLMEGVSPRAVETWPWSVSIILSSEYSCIGVLNWACTIFTPGSSISKGMLGAILAATFKSPGQIVLTVLTEEGVLRPLPQSIPEGVLQPLLVTALPREDARHRKNRENKYRQVRRKWGQDRRSVWTLARRKVFPKGTVRNSRADNLNEIKSCRR